MIPFLITKEIPRIPDLIAIPYLITEYHPPEISHMAAADCIVPTVNTLYKI